MRNKETINKSPSMQLRLEYDPLKLQRRKLQNLRDRV